MIPLPHCLAGCLLLFWQSMVMAVDELQLSMEGMVGEGWKLSGLEVALASADEDSAGMTVAVALLQVGTQELEQIQLLCPSIQIEGNSTFTCMDGRVNIARSSFGAIAGKISGQFFDAGHWQLNLNGLRFSKAGLQLDLLLKDERLQADFRLQGFNLSLMKDYFPSGWDIAGIVDVEGNLALESSVPVSLKASIKLTDFSYSSEDGLQVGENLSVQLNADISRAGDTWRGKTTLQVRQGQFYSDPFFVETNNKVPLILHLQGGLNTAGSKLEIKSLSFNYGEYLSGQGDLLLDLSTLKMQELNLAFRVADLAQVYAVLLQPLVIGSALDDMTVAGQGHGKVQLAQGDLQGFSLALQQVNVDQNAGLFGLSAVEADLHWHRSGKQQTSRLSWDGGHLYKIAFGELEAIFTASAGNVSLQPLSLPVLDGWLQLQDLKVGGLLDGNLNWQARAVLQDIQLRTLSQSLDWPELNGSLQATIPRLYYRDALLRMDGELLVDVFGGQLVVENLKLEDPLGVAPVFETGVRLDNLDLEQITQVFDFGRIEGSLEGYIRNLQLVAWQVTGFDASLRSPKKDERRRRISQRAIENLTELGNGASVNLSATMLRFFEDFAYEQLALTVRLRGAVAELDGVPNPQGGYYIVKGARLPRIDVIGRNHSVAWKDLLSRVRDIRFDDMIVE